MEKEALQLALEKNDVSLAKQIVMMIDEEEELRGELWLVIAKFIVQQNDFKGFRIC
jgi:hypothetical protein